jgi:hypothetical protein
VRFCKLLLLVFALTGCGQPLAMRTTPRATPPTAQTPRPTSAAPLATPGISERASATPAATALDTATLVPTAPVIVIQPKTPPGETNQARWRAQQLDRQVFDPPRSYVTRQGTALFWFDPRTSQSLEIGTLLGDFTATAQFTLRTSEQPALEVPYTINADYGLTAISDALIQRMRAAGYSERVEAYVFFTEATVAK